MKNKKKGKKKEKCPYCSYFAPCNNCIAKHRDAQNNAIPTHPPTKKMTKKV